MATSSGSATTGSSEVILNADEPCETMDFLDIMKVIDISPTLLATCLELDESDRLSAEYRTRGDYKELIFEILKCWQSRNGKKATWRKLIESLQRLGNVQLVESIGDLQAEKRKQKQSWSHHEISMLGCKVWWHVDLEPDSQRTMNLSSFFQAALSLLTEPSVHRFLFTNLSNKYHRIPGMDSASN